MMKIDMSLYLPDDILGRICDYLDWRSIIMFLSTHPCLLEQSNEISICKRFAKSYFNNLNIVIHEVIKDGDGREEGARFLRDPGGDPDCKSGKQQDYLLLSKASFKNHQGHLLCISM